MSEARAHTGAYIPPSSDASMWNHFRMPLGGSQLPGSLQGSASGSPAGLHRPCLQQPRAMNGPAALQMTSSQWGCTIPRPAEFNMVSPLQNIPPIATPRGLQFPSSQHPSYLVNSSISHPEKLHSGFQYMAPSQALKLQNPQLPPHPLNSHSVYPSMSQKELHRGLYLNQQSWAQAYGMGYSPGAPSSDAYWKMLQFRSDGSGNVSRMHFSASDRSSASKLPTCYEAAGQWYKNYAQNVAFPDQRVMESSQPTAYQMPHVDKLPSADCQRQALSSVSANSGQLQHLGNEVNVVCYGSSFRSECASGLPRVDSRLSQEVSSSCLLLSCAERESCALKESFCKSRNPSPKSKSHQCSQKNVDSPEYSAKGAEPDHGHREYDPQYLSSCCHVEQPVISSSVNDENNEDSASTSSSSCKEQGAKNNVNRDCGIEKSIRHSDLPGKQQMNVNSRSDSTNSCNEPEKCVQIASNTGMRKTVLDLLLASPLNKTTADTTPACQVNDSSVCRASGSPQDCHYARNPSACFLHNRRRSPPDGTRGLTDQTASDGNVLPAPDAQIHAVQLKDRQQEQSVTNNTSDNVAEQKVEKDIDVMRLMYCSDLEIGKKDIYDHVCMVCLKTFNSRDEVSEHLSVHLKSDEMGPEWEDDGLAQNTMETDQGCSTQLTLETEGDSLHVVLLPAGQMACERKVKKNIKSKACACDQSECCCNGQENKENSNSGASEDQKRELVSVAGQKHTVAATHKHETPVQLTSLSNSDISSAFEGRKRSPEKDQKGEHDPGKISESSADQNDFSSIVHKLQQCPQNVAVGFCSADSESHLISDHVVQETSETISENGKSNSRSDHSHLKPSGSEQRTEPSKSCSNSSKLSVTQDCSGETALSEQRTKTSEKSSSNSSKQSVAQDCCYSKVSLAEQRTKTSEKSSSNSPRQNVEEEKPHCDKVCVDSSRHVALSSEKRDASEKKFEHRAKAKQDSSALHSQVKQISHAQDGSSPAVSESGHSHQQKTKDGDIQQNKPTSLSTKQESFASDKKSVSIKRKCDSHHDGCKKRKHSDVTNAERRKYHSSKDDGELTANGKVAGSGLIRKHLAPISHRDTAYPKEDSKSYSDSKKQKSETSEKCISPPHCDKALKEGTKSHSHSKRRKLETPEQHTTPTAGRKEEAESHSHSKKHRMETSEKRTIPSSSSDTTRVKEDTESHSHPKKQNPVHRTSPTSHCHRTGLEEDRKPHSHSKKHKLEGSEQHTTPSSHCGTAGLKGGRESNSHCKKYKSDSSEQCTSPASDCCATGLKDGTKLHSHSKKDKMKPSQHAGLKSQMHSGTNKHSVKQKGMSTDNHPGMKEMTPLLQTPDSSFSFEPKKHASSASYQCSKQTGTTQCPEAHRDKNVKISAEKCSVSISNIEEASKTENNSQDNFKPSEQHHRKSTREEVVHNDLTTQEKEACASETATFAERNIDANCPSNRKPKHQEVTRLNDPAKESDYADAAKSKKDVEVSKGDTLSKNFDQMTAKTDKAKKIVSSLRNIFQNNKQLSDVLNKKVTASRTALFEKGAKTIHAENEAKGQSRPPKKNMEGAESNPKHTFQETISDSKDLCKRSAESGQDGCTSAVNAEIASETVVASDQADGKMLKTDSSFHQTVQENVSDDKNSQKGNQIKLTLCIKCMTMFANRSVYEEHGCCLNDKARETDHADATNSEDDEEVTKGHTHEVVKSDSFITCSKRTKHFKNKEENCASGSRLSDISDSESQQKHDDSGGDFRRDVKVVEMVKKKRKRILTYDEKKAKTMRQANSRDRRNNSKMSVHTMFSCDICNQTYSSRGGLLFHWQAVHKK